MYKQTPKRRYFVDKHKTTELLSIINTFTKLTTSIFVYTFIYLGEHIVEMSVTKLPFVPIAQFAILYLVNVSKWEMDEIK